MCKVGTPSIYYRSSLSSTLSRDFRHTLHMYKRVTVQTCDRFSLVRCALWQERRWTPAQQHRNIVTRQIGWKGLCLIRWESPGGLLSNRLSCVTSNFHHVWHPTPRIQKVCLFVVARVWTRNPSIARRIETLCDQDRSHGFGNCRGFGMLVSVCIYERKLCSQIF